MFLAGNTNTSSCLTAATFHTALATRCPAPRLSKPNHRGFSLKGEFRYSISSHIVVQHHSRDEALVFQSAVRLASSVRHRTRPRPTSSARATRPHIESAQPVLPSNRVPGPYSRPSELCSVHTRIASPRHAPSTRSVVESPRPPTMGDPGDGVRPPQQSSAQDAHGAWSRFLDTALRQRLDPDRFADFVPQLHARHPLAAAPLAALCLRPFAWNSYTLDPRMPLYLQTLLDLRLVDLQSVLAGLFRYSTAHTVVGKTGKKGTVKSENGGAGEDEEDSKTGVKDGSKTSDRWLSSSSSDEVMFYRLTKAVGSGSAIRNSRDAVEVCIMMARWMALFTAASAALPPAHVEDQIMGGIDGAGASSTSKKNRDDLENSRAACVMLLLAVCENPVVLQALSKPLAKGMSPHTRRGCSL